MTVQRGEGAPLKREKRETSGEEKNLLIQPLEHQTGQEGVLIASPVVAVVTRLVYL